MNGERDPLWFMSFYKKKNISAGWMKKVVSYCTVPRQTWQTYQVDSGVKKPTGTVL